MTGPTRTVALLVAGILIYLEVGGESRWLLLLLLAPGISMIGTSAARGWGR